MYRLAWLLKEIDFAVQVNKRENLNFTVHMEGELLYCQNEFRMAPSISPADGHQAILRASHSQAIKVVQTTQIPIKSTLTHSLGKTLGIELTSSC